MSEKFGKMGEKLNGPYKKNTIEEDGEKSLKNYVSAYNAIFV